MSTMRWRSTWKAASEWSNWRRVRVFGSVVRSRRFIAPSATSACAHEGQWPLPPGSPPPSVRAVPPQGATTAWAGFHRRWALGLRLEQRAPAPR